MVCRMNTWLFQIYILYVAWIHDFVKSLVVVQIPSAVGMIFYHHDKSRRYLTLMTVDTYLFGAWELDISIYPWFALRGVISKIRAN